MGITTTIQYNYSGSDNEPEKADESSYERFMLMLKGISEKDIPKLDKKFSKTIYVRTFDYVKNFYEDEFNKEFILDIFEGSIPTVTSISSDFDAVSFLTKEIDNMEIYYFQISSYPTRESFLDSINFNALVKYKDMIIYINPSNLSVIYTDMSLLYKKKDIFDSLCSDYCASKDKKSIFMILKTQSYYLNSFDVQDFGDDIFDNYNDDLIKVTETIVESLKTKSKGVIILDGKKGTGKTTYIRHLIKSVPGKKFIFVPSFLHNNLTNTDFITFLTNKCKNSVLILEDCESVLKSREQGGGGIISDLLNMADGLMSDVLKIQFICTFNTERSNIDEAILRPGRLIAEYQFGELEKSKAEKLYKKLGKPVGKSGYICDIYNSVPPKTTKETKKIGFTNK